jgi:hypothetical protein
LEEIRRKGHEIRRVLTEKYFLLEEEMKNQEDAPTNSEVWIL